MALFRRYLYNNRGILKSAGREFNETMDEFKSEITSGRLRYIFNRCVCDSTNERTISERDRFGLFYRYVLCMDCGLVRANPLMDSESTAYFYEKYYQRLYHDLPGLITSPEQEFETTVKFSSKSYIPFLNLQRKQRIIMIGCGTGASLYPFMKLGHECIGADFCVEKINYGRSRGLDLYVGHYEMLLELNKKADVILLFDVVEHFIDLKVDFKNISGLLADDGIVVIGVPDISRAYRYHGGDILMDTIYCHNYWFSRESLNSTLSALGYRFTGKYAYIGTPHGLVSVYARDEGPKSVYDPSVAKKTIRKLIITEYLFRLRRLLLIDFFVDKAAAFVRGRPLLKNLAYRILGKDEN